MKKLVLATMFLVVAASSALAQKYASWDPDPNVRLQVLKDSQNPGG